MCEKACKSGENCGLVPADWQVHYDNKDLPWQ